MPIKTYYLRCKIKNHCNNYSTVSSSYTIVVHCSLAECQMLQEVQFTEISLWCLLIRSKSVSTPSPPSTSSRCSRCTITITTCSITTSKTVSTTSSILVSWPLTSKSSIVSTSI